MGMKMIDLRSDTVTKPSKAMQQAMSLAEVGDDVMGEDPTVNRLEEITAELLGKEDALFVTSGTQGNLISTMVHCQRGEEYIAGTTSHLFHWEGGGVSVLGGIFPQPISFEKDGSLDLDKVKKMIKPDDDHFARTKLLALENTQNGKVLPLGYFKKAALFAKEHKLAMHLDGARLFNAVVESNVSPQEIAAQFDSVTFCLSKGLGAPVGSVICANKEFIKEARRLRKTLGGGMRQAGILAAAGLYALENNVKRLREDHENAALLAQGLKGFGELEANTNMVFLQVGAHGRKLEEFLRAKGIMIWGGETLRLVTHLDIKREDIERVIGAFAEYYESFGRGLSS